jgi:hypothetical protein
VQKATAIGAFVLEMPAGLSTGSSITMIITQDVTGGRTMSVVNADIKFAAGYKTLSTFPGAIDMLNCFYDGTTLYVTLTTGYS